MKLPEINNDVIDLYDDEGVDTAASPDPEDDTTKVIHWYSVVNPQYQESGNSRGNNFKVGRYLVFPLSHKEMPNN